MSENDDDDLEEYKLVVQNKDIPQNANRMNMHFDKQKNNKDKSSNKAYFEKKSLERENYSDYEDNKSDKKVVILIFRKIQKLKGITIQPVKCFQTNKTMTLELLVRLH